MKSGLQLARKYTEFEKMDTGIKKALPQSGTKAFPRAPLPSTNFQTSENLCRSLESYLEALLHDDRYASSDPVALFFAKERTDSKGDVQPLAFLGRGVNNLGKGVTGVTRGIGKGGEMAIGGITTGFGQFGKAVTTIPGLRRSTSDHAETILSTPGRHAQHFAGPSDPNGSEQDLLSPTSLKSSLPASSSSEPSEVQLIENLASDTSIDDVDIAKVGDGEAMTTLPILSPRPGSPGGYEVPASASKPFTTATASLKENERPEAPVGFSYTPRKKMVTTVLNTTHDMPASSIHFPKSPILGGRMSFDELVTKDKELQKRQDEDLVAATAFLNVDKMQKSSSEPIVNSPSPAVPVTLSPAEFNNILSFAMAILEEAYDLADSTWNIRRGILKVLETLLRTSYAGVIKAGVIRLVSTASEEAYYARNIDKLRKSFWPPPANL